MQADLELMPREIGESMLDQLPFNNARELILSSKSLKHKYENYLEVGTDRVNYFTTLESEGELAPTGYPLTEFYNEFLQKYENSLKFRYIRNKIEGLNTDEIAQLMVILFNDEQPSEWDVYKYLRQEFFASFTLPELVCAIHTEPMYGLEDCVSLEYDASRCNLTSPYFEKFDELKRNYCTY